MKKKKKNNNNNNKTNMKMNKKNNNNINNNNNNNNNNKNKKLAAGNKLSSIMYHKSTAPRPKRLVFPTSCLSTSLLAPIIHPALPSRKRRSIPVVQMKKLSFKVWPGKK